jgi:hypothetical protein
VGEYELSADFHLVIRHEGDQLTVQATGQGKLPLFAESDRAFFLKVVDAQITFEGDAGGPASRLVLHQNGQDQPGRRIK